MTSANDEHPRSPRPTIALALITLMCLAFGVIAYRSALTKSATFDEPIHFVGGFIAWNEGDYRIDTEHPPLFKYWAMLPQRSDALKIDRSIRGWDESLRVPWLQWQFIKPTLYRTGGPDPDALLARSRFMMTLLGVALAGIVAWWAWDLAGPWAAVIACALYCFDPNFLGHAPLVKNDVPIALAMVALVFAVSRAGRRLTYLNALALALLCAAAPLIKLSGTFGIAVVLALVLARAFWREPWRVLHWSFDRFARKLLASVTLIALCGIVTYTGVWACYRFRYSITPDRSQRLDLSVITRSAMAQQLKNERGTEDDPSQADIDAAMSRLPMSMRLITWADDHRLLPQAWLSANLSMMTVQTRSISYLHGEVNASGWWYYFPLAFIYKEPLATIACVLIAPILAFRIKGTRPIISTAKIKGRVPFTCSFTCFLWDVVCIGVFLALYGLTGIASARNVGFRHVFPMLPMTYVLAGVALSRAILLAPRASTIGLSVLMIALMSETLARTPNFIAFFNVACGGPRGGLRLLSDSNLDWGQDLLLLRDWQQRNPNVGLRLFYFGGAEPNYYVRTQRFRKAELTEPHTDGSQAVVAISATTLQGTFARGQAARDYAFIRQHEPLEVLGGTIYIYPLPLRK